MIISDFRFQQFRQLFVPGLALDIYGQKDTKNLETLVIANGMVVFCCIKGIGHVPCKKLVSYLEQGKELDPVPIKFCDCSYRMLATDQVYIYMVDASQTRIDVITIEDLPNKDQSIRFTIQDQVVQMEPNRGLLYLNGRSQLKKLVWRNEEFLIDQIMVPDRVSCIGVYQDEIFVGRGSDVMCLSTGEELGTFLDTIWQIRAIDHRFLILVGQKTKDLQLGILDIFTKDFYGLEDPTNSDPQEQPFYHFEVLQDWGPNIERLVIVSSSRSPYIGLVGKDGEKFRLWNVALDEYMGSFPMANEISDKDIIDGELDTFPTGTALDFSNEIPLANPSGEASDPDFPPCPLLWCINTRGWIMCYQLVNGKYDGQYPEMVRALVSVDSKNNEDTELDDMVHSFDQEIRDLEKLRRNLDGLVASTTSSLLVPNLPTINSNLQTRLGELKIQVHGLEPIFDHLFQINQIKDSCLNRTPGQDPRNFFLYEHQTLARLYSQYSQIERLWTLTNILLWMLGREHDAGIVSKELAQRLGLDIHMDVPQRIQALVSKLQAYTTKDMDELRDSKSKSVNDFSYGLADADCLIKDDRHLKEPNNTLWNRLCRLGINDAPQSVPVRGEFVSLLNSAKAGMKITIDPVAEHRPRLESTAPIAAIASPITNSSTPNPLFGESTTLGSTMESVAKANETSLGFSASNRGFGSFLATEKTPKADLTKQSFTKHRG